MQDIVVYVDQGVSGEALRQTVKSLQQELDLNFHALKRMDARRLISEAWEKETALVVMPGGRDVYYHSALDGMGTKKLRHFVEKGGSYLGLCAGAYFAAEAIEFEKGGRLQVCGKRSLELFPGRALGPAYGPGKYSYENEQGVEAAHISWGEEECFAYFNGGCYFEGAHKFANVRVLSSYLNLEDRPAAVIECSVGKGTALLSGVHIEFNSNLLGRGSHYLDRIHPLLEQTEKKRRAIFREVLKGLGLRLKPF
jgi:biotin--protein ligase